MPEADDTSTHELKIEQRERKRGERDAEKDSITPDEADQHRRRADKAEYLEEKLAERERSERDRGLDP
jgi:hypothetical protein